MKISYQWRVVCEFPLQTQNLHLYVQSFNITSVQFSSVPQSCLTLSNLMDCSLPGSSILLLLKLFQSWTDGNTSKLILWSQHFPPTKARQFSTVQSCTRVQLFATLWTATHQASVSITNSWSLLKFMSIESVMPSNHPIFCHPLLLLSSIFLNTRVFSKESVLCLR